LVASGNGYYVATEAEEVEHYIQSLDGRIEAMEAVRDALQEQLQMMKEWYHCGSDPAAAVSETASISISETCFTMVFARVLIIKRLVISLL
jgi:prefoldin subunit 5